MTAFPPRDSASEQPSSRLTIKSGAQWQAQPSLAPGASAVLGAEDPSPTLPPGFELFAAEGAAYELTAQPESSAVLGADDRAPGTVELEPGDDASYVLLQLIETDAGTIYDFTLPQAAPDEGQAAVLGASASPKLVFPIRPIVLGGSPPAAPAAVLGVEDLITGAIGGVVGDIIRKRVVQMIKAPIDRAILAGVANAEGAPKVLALRDTSQPDQLFQPLDGAEAWRALLPPSADHPPHRVLLFLHGFASSTARSSAAAFLPALAPGYDAVLSYDYPTISRDPLRSALDILAQVPEDLRLSVDIVGHCYGGLVARSLAELADPVERFVPRALVTCGTPHAGTVLASPDRWDRLISLTMTGISWLAALSGFATPVPKIIEWVLRSAAQSVFALPGMNAMAPSGSPFLALLNAPASGAAARPAQARYAAVSSRFSLFSVQPPSFRQAFEALAAQAFIDRPNDLIVPTDSMVAIDAPASLPAAQQHMAAVNHWGYFQDAATLDFIRAHFGGCDGKSCSQW